MPFAARRLFDAEGREHHTLKDLNRDELVYATCGEVWIDPKISKAESQRRILLTSLSSDIAQIRQFCALRDTEGFYIIICLYCHQQLLLYSTVGGNCNL